MNQQNKTTQTKTKGDNLSREMLINVAQEEECRIAIVENGQLEELYVERSTSSRHVGNIYKGVITNIEPSIQACFIDFGIGQNGFLHISDLQTCFFPNNSEKERVGRKRPRRERPPIQDCLKRGQELVVQVIKEGIGTKGPTLTTYLSIPGRFMVLMPGMNRSGISRKIEDEESRAKLRDLLKQLDPPKDMGVIIRTAGMDRGKRDLQRDMNYLLRLWKTVTAQEKKVSGPQELYKESDLVIRTLRDVFNSNINRIICDCEETVKKITEFLRIAMPRTRCPIQFHNQSSPLFAKNHIEEKIAEIQSRHVALQSGGSLVIDSTEALVAIDVNSGKNRVHDSAEITAYKINVEAAKEISRQLRLRDLGGVIIIDFIDMLQEKHRRGVEREFRDATSSDRARTKILRISQFGIVEMTRQRMRPSFERSRYMDCPHCQGSGLIKTPESMSIEIMRRMQSVIAKSRVDSIEIEVSAEVAYFLQNKKRLLLSELETTHKKTVVVRTNSDFSNDEINFTGRDERGSVIKENF
jgi:ribonuclease E